VWSVNANGERTGEMAGESPVRLSTRSAVRGKVAQFFSGILRKVPPGFVVRRALVNGRPGLIGYFEDGRPQSVVTFDVAEESIRAIRLVVNPEKLRAVPPLR
jgi:hypothetical protein